MIKLIFLGSDKFPIPLFERLCNSTNTQVVGLVTTPNITEKKLEILAAKMYKIPIFKPKSINKEFQNIFDKTKPDIILVCNYGQILSKEILKYPKHGCLNIHCSLLPKLRGACPIEVAILKGLKETGVTIQLMSEELDTGNILFQKKVEIKDNDTAGSLSRKLQKLMVENVEKVIINWTKGKIKPKEQNHSKATFCYRQDKSKDAARIDWKNTAKEIDRKVRAFNPNSIAWTMLKLPKGAKRLKIFKAKTSNKDLDIKHGNTKIKEGKLLIQTGKGVLIPEIVQLEGKKKMPTEQFLKGFREEIILL